MAYEIEHKYTVYRDLLPPLVDGIKIVQGYLPQSDYSNTVTRIRIYGNMAYLTIKSENQGSLRREYEYEIPYDDGIELLELCEDPLLKKTRYVTDYSGHTWEIDVFEGNNEGLIVAEIEFEEIGEMFHIPNWVNRDVTTDKRYYNSNLVHNPYRAWI